jgi:drug/metabolite transporter (DMT)-like permease
MPRRQDPATTDGGRIWLGLAVLYVVWGSTYLGIAVAVATIPPFLMAGSRFALAGAVLLAWTRMRGTFVRPTRREWLDTAIVGALLLGGGMGMVAWGEQSIPSGIAALMVALMPVWVAILGRLAFGERLPRLAVVGIVIGFVGVAILVGPTALGATGALDPAGVAALVISPIAWASGSLYASHRARLPRQPLVATGTQMLAGSIVLVAMATATGEWARFSPTTVSGPSIAAFLYLVVVGSLLAFTVFGWLLRVAPLPFIATYAYVNPVVAVALGTVVLHEALEPRTLIAGGVIVGAVALIVTARGRMAAPRRTASARAVGPAGTPLEAPPRTASAPSAPATPAADAARTRSASG